jgi:exopolysaccharide biosynthesis polyprenyl glycosylphosphotransferase
VSVSVSAERSLVDAAETSAPSWGETCLSVEQPVDRSVDHGVAPSEMGKRAGRTAFQPKLVLMAADLSVIVAAIVLSYFLTLGPGNGDSESARHFVGFAAMTLPIWIGIFARQRLYNTRFIGRRLDEFRRLVNAVGLSTLSVALTAFFFGELIARLSLVVLFFSAVVFVAAEREVARRVFSSLRERGRLVRHVVIAGANPEGRELAGMLQADTTLGYRVLGFVDDTVTEPYPAKGIPLLGTVSEAAAIVRRHEGASVIVAASAIESATTNRLARDLLDEGIHVELSSTLRDIASQRLTVRPLGRFPVVYVEPVQREGWRRMAKRGFDIIGATVGLVIASPVLLVAAIAIKLDSRGPVLFKQSRVGRDSEPFSILKLRSMVQDAEAQLIDLAHANEADGPLFKIKDDPRITRVGRLIRRTSVDEIPQLWNVLRGEMSLVGPRPALRHETEAWDPLLTQRLRVKPGLTGMWQVNGRSESSFEDYTRLDLYYVDNWSLLTDIAILAKTVPVVMTSRGAS